MAKAEALQPHVDTHSLHSLPVSQNLSSLSSLPLIKTGCARVLSPCLKALATQHPPVVSDVVHGIHQEMALLH